MTESQHANSTRGKLDLFRACFSGLGHVYGTYDPRTGRTRQVKDAVTDDVLLRHLQGREPYGVYLLVGDQTRAIVADFDHDDTGPVMKFIQRARSVGVSAYPERSKRKGWHAWVFLQPPGANAAKARRVIKWILAEIGMPATEVFPKQDRLDDRNVFGNFVNAPLFGLLVPRGRTVFVNPDRSLEPWPDQWAMLKSVERVPESSLDRIISRYDLNNHRASSVPNRERVAIDMLTFGLPPCARRMLAEGVADHQRVACFRLAVHLKKAGLPRDLALACLRAWASKNHPAQDKRIITPAEIEGQVDSAYLKHYRGCGCEEAAMQPYCAAGCPLHRSRDHADGNAPASEKTRAMTA